MEPHKVVQQRVVLVVSYTYQWIKFLAGIGFYANNRAKLLALKIFFIPCLVKGGPKIIGLQGSSTSGELDETEKAP